MVRSRPDLANLIGFGPNDRDPAWSGQIRPGLAKMAGIKPESSHVGRIRPNMLVKIRQRRPDVAGFRQQLHFRLS
jgi:hypothetical protein